MRTLQDLQRLETSVLIDLLAENTSKYTKMFAEKTFGEEYDDTKEMMNQLMMILEVRGVAKPDMPVYGELK